MVRKFIVVGFFLLALGAPFLPKCERTIESSKSERFAEWLPCEATAREQASDYIVANSKTPLMRQCPEGKACIKIVNMPGQHGILELKVNGTTGGCVPTVIGKKSELTWAADAVWVKKE